jgi:heme/copper-type cytochrome/quinol oxidase subunit 3
VSRILLSNEIIIYLFTQIILFILLFIAFYFSISIIKNWDYEKTTTKQYKLEKTSYLVILIISFTLISKNISFALFYI